MADRTRTLRAYFESIRKDTANGVATEHTHRPALKALLQMVEAGVTATNEPRRIECGAPDFVVSRGQTTVGYVEAKDVGASLDEASKTDQLKRYRESLGNLVLTNYLEFRWFVDGAERGSARLGGVTAAGKVAFDRAGGQRVQELLESFYALRVPSVGTPKELAERMARLARMTRDLIVQAFEREAEGGTLHSQLAAFRETLIPDLSTEQFADMYAQTIAYGLFAARTMWDGNGTFSRQNAAWLLPRTNPFLRSLFNHIAGPDLDDRIAWVVDDLAQLLAEADMAAVLQDFGKRTRKEDPVVHFYETFLKEYDPKTREMRGVYYTPEPVVSYIVRSVDYLLRERFGRPQGLADPNTLVLDPAVGTGTFLYTAIKLINDTLTEQGRSGGWNDYVARHLLPRVFGFELLMAPYAIAHLKLGLELQELGYQFASDQRLGLYLTNTLQEAIQRSETFFAQFITDEANAAARIKAEEPIMVVMGNPPYSGHSANRSEVIVEVPRTRLVNGKQLLVKGGKLPATVKRRVRTFIGGLIEDYKRVDGQPLGEKNPKWLQDDYVKFLRFGQWRIERTGQGILGFITNHGYLDNPTFRGMRQQLMNSFSDIYVLDLHGNAKKRERAPDGGPDENVFDIQQGVAIGIFVKEAGREGPARVHHADVWGERGVKYRGLQAEEVAVTEWRTLEPVSPFYLWVPVDSVLLPEYSRAWRVTEIFGVFASTVTTARNHFAMAYDPDALIKRINDLRDRSRTDESLRTQYALRDVSYWSLKTAREGLRNSSDVESFVRPYCYRPFDFRFVFYHEAVCERLRPEVMRHMRGGNIALLTHRPQSPGEFSFAYCTRMIGDQCVAANKTAGGGNSFQFPLYLFATGNAESGGQGQMAGLSPWPAGKDGRRPNLNPEFVAEVEGGMGLAFVSDGCGDLESTFGPEDVFHYIYAVLHSPTYRSRYAEFLKRDFPRVPLTLDRKLFAALAGKGAELVALHVMESPALGQVVAKFLVGGTNEVEKVRYSEPEKRVWINKTQYFEGVEPEVWGFHIGGYQVCEKWVKDRRGRKLSYDDVAYYQKIVVALKETMRLMGEIDALIPGWPIE